MQTKTGLKRMIMNKGSDKTFTDLHEAYIKKCKVNNLSEYTINFITLQMGITKYCKKRGIEKYSLHLFRHTFGLPALEVSERLRRPVHL